jgi:hypothetical protein
LQPEDFKFAQGWEPNLDIVEGAVTSIDIRRGEYEPYPVVTIVPDDGKSLAVHAFHTSLKNQLADLDVQVGDRIAILHLGRQRTKDGKREFEGYRVKKLGGESKKIDWDTLAETDPAPTSDIPVLIPEAPPEVGHAPSSAEVDDDVPF